MGPWACWRKKLAEVWLPGLGEGSHMQWCRVRSQLRWMSRRWLSSGEFSLSRHRETDMTTGFLPDSTHPPPSHYSLAWCIGRKHLISRVTCLYSPSDTILPGKSKENTGHIMSQPGEVGKFSHRPWQCQKPPFRNCFSVWQELCRRL